PTPHRCSTSGSSPTPAASSPTTSARPPPTPPPTPPSPNTANRARRAPGSSGRRGRGRRYPSSCTRFNRGGDMTTEVISTGTGTPHPTPGRAAAGTLVRTGQSAVQVDAGQATVPRMAEAGTRRPDPTPTTEGSGARPLAADPRNSTTGDR